jgi:hypothetical protein
VQVPRRRCSHTLTLPSPVNGRGFHLLCGTTEFPRPRRQLERPQPAVEHPAHLQRLVGRDLAGRHRPHGDVIGRDDIACAGPLRQVELDRPAARRRLQPADDEARGDQVAGQGLVDDDAGGGNVLAGAQRLAQHGRPVASPRFLAGRIAGASRNEPAIAVALCLMNRTVHMRLHRQVCSLYVLYCVQSKHILSGSA